MAAPPARIEGTAPVPVQTSATPAPRATQSAKRLVIIAVKDSEGDGHSGVPVTYRPLAEGKAVTFLSGSGGITRLQLLPGRYRIGARAGCASEVEIFKASAPGTLGVAASGPTPNLTIEVEARRRYWPGTPVTWQPEPPWPRGEAVTFRYSVYDRCRDRLAPNATLGRIVYRPSSEIQLAAKPQARADGESYVTLSLRCAKAGDARLIVSDPDDPDDSVDLLRLRPQFDPSAKWCA